VINHNLKIDVKKFNLLITGKHHLIIQHDPNSKIKVGEILSYTKIDDNRDYPDEFRCLATHIEKKHVEVGYIALQALDIDKLGETSLMGIGSLTPEQRAKLRVEAWEGLGLAIETQTSLSEANRYKKQIKELTGPKCKLVEGKKQANIEDFTNQLFTLFTEEKAAIEFLER